MIVAANKQWKTYSSEMLATLISEAIVHREGKYTYVGSGVEQFSERSLCTGRSARRRRRCQYGLTWKLEHWWVNLL